MSDAPIARQKELELAQHHNWPVYWAIDGLGGFGAVPIATPVEPPAGEAGPPQEEGDPHLRSVREVLGYRIHATDGDIGHTDDLMVDDDEWTVRYLIVDTRSWLPGGEVILATDWIQDVSWDDAKIVVCHRREEIKNSPKYDSSIGVSREYEELLHNHYGRPRYWEKREKVSHGKSSRKK